MFGNAGTLSKPTRGSIAYPVSSSSLDIFPGNGGGSSTQQDIEVFDQSQDAVTMLSGITGGPGNTIFRGATVIGQGAQIFVQGGLASLEFGSGQTSPPIINLSQSVGVWNGDSQRWGDTANIFVPKKSKGLMIGLIVGGVILLVLIGLGIWYYKRRQRLRQLEEDERQAKGMVLKNEDQLQKEHRISRPSNVETADGSASTAFPVRTAYDSPDRSVYVPLQQPSLSYMDGPSTARSSFNSPHSYNQAELVGDGVATEHSERPPLLGPQEYPATTLVYVATSNISRAPSHYQTVVNVTGRPISHGVAKHELADIEPSPLSPGLLANGGHKIQLTLSSDIARDSIK
ncbi:hypothetical protein BGZ58_006298 [Dissophora ornata]|nr:hypothetical protein BGZ58_006298 [Dissophora ornata]